MTIKLLRNSIKHADAGIRTRVVGLEGPSNNQTIPHLQKRISAASGI